MNRWNAVNSFVVVIAVGAFILAILNFIMIQDLYIELATVRRSIVEILDILKGILWRLG